MSTTPKEAKDLFNGGDGGGSSASAITATSAGSASSGTSSSGTTSSRTSRSSTSCAGTARSSAESSAQQNQNTLTDAHIDGAETIPFPLTSAQERFQRLVALHKQQRERRRERNSKLNKRSHGDTFNKQSLPVSTDGLHVADGRASSRLGNGTCTDLQPTTVQPIQIKGDTDSMPSHAFSCHSPLVSEMKIMNATSTIIATKATKANKDDALTFDSFDHGKNSHNGTHTDLQPATVPSVHCSVAVENEYKTDLKLDASPCGGQICGPINAHEKKNEGETAEIETSMVDALGHSAADITAAAVTDTSDGTFSGTSLFHSLSLTLACLFIFIFHWHSYIFFPSFFLYFRFCDRCK